MTHEVRSAMIDTFWVVTAVRHAGQSVSQISTSDSGVRHEIEVENCSGFPAEVTVVGELPQSGISFRAVGAVWTKQAKQMQRDETRTLHWDIEMSGCTAGAEPIHAGIKEYIDRNATSRHVPATPKPLFIYLTII